MSVYNRLLESVIECSFDSVIGLNKSGKILLFNSMAELVFQIKRDQVIGKKYNEVRFDESFIEFLDEVFHNPSPGAIEKIFNLPDGKVFSVFLVPLVKGDKLDGLIAIMRDFTELRNIEKAMMQFVGNASQFSEIPHNSY
jgi:two-component system, OmpR family, phosphate regulon sensor histidine kinase PhoR